MNVILAIDTSTDRTSVALISAKQVLWSSHEDGVTAHAEAVPRLVQKALEISNEISQVIVGMGPVRIRDYAQEFLLRKPLRGLGT